MQTGIEGTIKSKQISSFNPNFFGSRGSIIFLNSKNEPGQPWLIKSGIEFVFLPFS